MEEANKTYQEQKYKQLEKKYEILKRQWEAADSKANQIFLAKLQSTPGLVKYYTGLSSYESMKIIYDFCEPYIPFSKCKMKKLDVFIMMFIKLRLDFPFKYFAYQNDLSVKTISKLFHKCLVVVYRLLSGFVFWPDDLAHKTNSPAIFKKAFGNRSVFIMDCFEIFVETPGKILILCLI